MDPHDYARYGEKDSLLALLDARCDVDALHTGVTLIACSCS